MDDSPFNRFGELNAKVALVTATVDKAAAMGGMSAYERYNTPTIPRVLSAAEVVCGHLADAFEEFQKGLRPDEEVGAMLAQFGQAITIGVESVSRRGGQLVVFTGTDAQGRRCTLVQHVSQANVMLIALPAKDPEHPRRIGFSHPHDDSEPEAESGAG